MFMKCLIASIVLLVSSKDFTAFAFTTAFSRPSPSCIGSCSQRFMFGGAGAGSPTEDDPEKEKAIADGAAAMGMPLEEYKLAMRAREQLVQTMNNKIVTAGNADTIMVERDVNNPPKKFDVTITEAGKQLGRQAVSEELVKVLGKCKVEAGKGRQEAQQEMLKWVQSQAS